MSIELTEKVPLVARYSTAYQQILLRRDTILLELESPHDDATQSIYIDKLKELERRKMNIEMKY